MSIGEQAFLDRWRSEAPIFSAWGTFVLEEISNSISKLIAPQSVEMFIRIPVRPRLKGEDSLLQKAFHRNKAYKNPYEDIEDKVGLRFVVLLVEDIRTIESAITSNTKWIAHKARDFEDEQDARPYEFDYQSVHYIVRSGCPLSRGVVSIPQGIPCEVQVRTLLQHAYSELTHDTIYKPSVQASPAVKRAAAKSMALIEATSDYFSNVYNVIRSAVDRNERLARFLRDKYSILVGRQADETPLNSIIIDHYKQFLCDSFEVEFQKWADEKNYLGGVISERFDNYAIFRVPSILLVYYCASKSPRLAKRDSPLTDAELSPIYSDLGLGMAG